MTSYRATVAYDGAGFHGFQRQVAEQRTIQAELERVLTRLAQAPITITGAGRTDAGVHARGQVIGFELTTWRHGAAALQNALNAGLPDAIAVRDLRPAPLGFHPRFDARRRVYRYTIYNAAVPDPLLRRTSWHIRARLDIERLNEAAAVLLGQHDFATFGTAPQGNNTVRDLYRAHWQREQTFVTFEVVANAFLKRMVRSLVGTLRLVGDGRWTAAMFNEAFQAAERKRAGPSAPAHGLVLESVIYE